MEKTIHKKPVVKEKEAAPAKRERYVGAIGRSSCQTYVEMRIEGDEKLYAEGAAKVVWMDTQTGKSVPLPDHVRASLEAE